MALLRVIWAQQGLTTIGGPNIKFMITEIIALLGTFLKNLTNLDNPTVDENFEFL